MNNNIRKILINLNFGNTVEGVELLDFQYKINRKSTKNKETAYKLYKYKPKTS